MKILVACEFSGIVRNAFAAEGHDAWSCDLLPSETVGNHIICDHDLHILDILLESWDLIIAHPPCTFLANSGVRWLSSDTMRWEQMEHASRFFKAFLDAPAKRVCVENPIIHKHAASLIGRRQDQIIQPWQFGHGETKATCLWLKNLPLLKPTDIVCGRAARVHKEPPSPDRWKNRSRTLPGIARAMGETMGELIMNTSEAGLQHPESHGADQPHDPEAEYEDDGECYDCHCAPCECPPDESREAWRWPHDT